jgi:hypothetical protein
MKFPVECRESAIEPILAEDTNAKYFHAVKYHWTDDLAHAASAKRI